MSTKDTNIGNRNQGNNNTGDGNQGNNNTGDGNIGSDNKGNRNQGDHNTGNGNIGNDNLGNNNFGSDNKGNRNIGYYNRTSNTWGNFNTVECDKDVYHIFNKAANRSRSFWAGDIKADWNTMSDKDKLRYLTLENFDAAIFQECTGIVLTDEDYMVLL